MSKAAISLAFYVSSVWCGEILQGWLISCILPDFFHLFLQGPCRETVYTNFKDMHSLAFVAGPSLFPVYMDCQWFSFFLTVLCLSCLAECIPLVCNRSE